jgi:LuxR family maltose regulon positive regulatory protein
VTETIRYAQEALGFVAESDHVVRGSGAALLGLSYWRTGDLETAYRRYAEARASLQKAEHLSDVLGCSIALADIRIAQGRLHDAAHIYERALALAAEQGEPVVRGTPDMYVGLGALHCERNDLDAATKLLVRSTQLGDLVGLPQNPYRWCVVMARIREAQGDTDGALELLQDAERMYVSDFFPNVRPIAALKARVWVRQGRVGEALAWVQEQGLSVENDLSYLHEFEHTTLARVLLAQHASDRNGRSLQEVIEFLDRLKQAAEGGERAGSVLEISILQALAHAAGGDIAAARVALERALALAEPGGYVRAFVDEGPPMARLLRDAVARGIGSAYAGAALAAHGTEPQGSASPLPASRPLVEPLSERELDVLRLLRTDLSGPEIARELVVAPSTFRTHTKRIYSKLGVTNRRAAVKRAADLGLI